MGTVTDAVHAVNDALARHKAKTEEAGAEYKAWIVQSFLAIRKEFFPCVAARARDKAATGVGRGEAGGLEWGSSRQGLAHPPRPPPPRSPATPPVTRSPPSRRPRPLPRPRRPRRCSRT